LRGEKNDMFEKIICQIYLLIGYIKDG